MHIRRSILSTPAPFDGAEPLEPLGTGHKSRRLRSFLAGTAGLVVLSAVGTAGAQTITVDAANSPRGNPHFWSTCVGTGTASLTLRADLQTHFKLAKRELGMQRVRGHGVLNDDMGIFTWSGGAAAPTYDWSKYDKYLAAIAAAGMRPIIELSFMPTDLARNGSDRDPASDLEIYGQMIQAVVAHTVELYGEEDVSKWYWEVWNEPNYEGFWNGTMEEYYEMYDAAAAGAVAALPNILIGGPVTTQGSTTQMTDFLAHVATSGARVTFLSSHAYPGGAGPDADATFGVSDNDGRVDVITSAGFNTDTFPSFNTEWNSAYTGQGGNLTDNNVSMDSHANAPFILKSVKLLADQVVGDKPPLDVFAYWVISDVFGEYGSDAGSYIESQGDGTLPFGSVFGLTTYQGVRKAAYNAFRMLNYLGSQQLAVTGGTGNSDGVDAYATVNEAGDEVAVILYNYYKAIATSGNDEVTLNVNNLPFAGQSMFVTKFGIDPAHSNPYGVWVGQGKPNNPTEAEWQALRKAQHLALLEPVSTVTAAATYAATLTLPKQGAAMILLSLKRPVTGRDALMEIEGEDYDGQSGATKEDSNDTSMGQSIALSAGGHVYYEVVDFRDAGVASVQLRVNAQAATTLALHADTQDGPLLGTCDIAATSGMWATQSCALSKTTGVHTLYAVPGGAVRLNWMKFETEGGMGGVGGAGGMGPGGSGGAAGMASGGNSGTSAGGSLSNGGAMAQAGGTTSTSGGAPPTGAGGSPPTGGFTSTGGAAAAGATVSGGAPGAGGSSTSSPDGDSSGCGCRVASNRTTPLDRFVLPGLVGLGLVFRRRRLRLR
jgi:xylan 1,4-beta-xylosidase